MFPVIDSNLNLPKFVGRCRAIVIANEDPNELGRIRVYHPLLGETNWIEYLQVPNCYFIPQVGDVVFVESECGDIDVPVAWGNLNRRDSGLSSLADVPDTFIRQSPDNRGIYSPGGHLVEIDDGSDIVGTDKGIRLTTSDESKIHIVEEPTTKKIIIERTEGASIEIDGLTDEIVITTNNGDSVTLSSTSGIEITNSIGDVVTMSNGTIEITDSGGDIITLSGGDIDITNVGGDNINMSSGTIAITDVSGDALTITNGTFTLEDSTGNSIVSGANSIEATTSGGAALTLSGPECSVKDATGAGVVIKSGKVALGASAAEMLDLFDKTLQEMNTILTNIQAITVPTAVGPSGPPVNAAMFATSATNLAALKTQLGIIKGSM